MKNDPIQEVVQKSTNSQSPDRIIGATNGNGTVKPVKASNTINPGGANPAAELPASSNLPAPVGNQAKAALPNGSLPKNLPASRSNAQKVTDSKGNLIPEEKRTPKN